MPQGSPSNYTEKATRRNTEAPGQQPQQNSQPTAGINFARPMSESFWKQLFQLQLMSWKQLLQPALIPGIIEINCPYSELCPNCQIMIKYKIVVF